MMKFISIHQTHTYIQYIRARINLVQIAISRNNNMCYHRTIDHFTDTPLTCETLQYILPIPGNRYVSYYYYQSTNTTTPSPPGVSDPTRPHCLISSHLISSQFHTPSHSSQRLVCMYVCTILPPIFSITLTKNIGTYVEQVIIPVVDQRHYRRLQ